MQHRKRRSLLQLSKCFGSFFAVMFAVTGCGGSNTAENTVEGSIASVPEVGFRESVPVELCLNGIEENLSVEEFAIAWGDVEVALQPNDAPAERLSEARAMAESSITSFGYDELIASTPPGGQKEYLFASCQESLRVSGANSITEHTGMAMLVDGYRRCLTEKTFSPAFDELDELGDPELADSIRAAYETIEDQVAATWTHLCPQFTPDSGGW